MTADANMDNSYDGASMQGNGAVLDLTFIWATQDNPTIGLCLKL